MARRWRPPFREDSAEVRSQAEAQRESVRQADLQPTVLADDGQGGACLDREVETLQHADAIVREELKAAGLEREIWQSFAVLPDIRSVGVIGDERTYGWPIVIRAVTSEDAMTADWARIPYEVLEAMSSRVINEVPGVNRVAYDITSKPPGTIEWE